MRQNPAVRAGTYPFTAADLDTGWHTHDLHQIEYAAHGVVEVETETGHYLLPPQRAIWLPAGLRHRTVLKDVRTVSVFFDPVPMPDGGDVARVLAVPPVFREMVLYGSRWQIDRTQTDPLADAFFDLLARLVPQWWEGEPVFVLPISQEKDIAAVMAYTSAHLATVTVAGVSRAVGMSERTLRRRFLADTGMTWRQYLLHSRLLRAMAKLTEPEANVLDVAIAVGFESASAFTRAFTQYAGQTPSSYRRRALPPQG